MRSGKIALVLALLPGCFSRTVEVIEAPPRYSTTTRSSPSESPLFALEITEQSARTIRLKVTRQLRCEETTLAIVERKESSSTKPGTAVYVLSGVLAVAGFILIREGNAPAAGGLALATGAGLLVSHLPFSEKNERVLPADATTVLQTPTTCQPGLASGVIVRARSGAVVTEGRTNAQGEVLLELPLTEAPLFFVQGDAIVPSGLRLLALPSFAPETSPSSLPAPVPPKRVPGNGELW